MEASLRTRRAKLLTDAVRGKAWLDDKNMIEYFEAALRAHEVDTLRLLMGGL